MQNIVKKDPGRARQNSLATAETISPNLERIIEEISVVEISPAQDLQCNVL